MFSADHASLIRCDCGHAVAEHSAAGCAAGPKPCRCAKSSSAVVLDEIALLRPQWFAEPERTNGRPTSS
jgi:hypothetical protein